MMKHRLIFIFFFIFSLLNAQQFPFKNENKFDTLEYKRIRDSLIAHPQKNTSQTIKENGVFYETRDGTSIIMRYNKKDGGFLQITKGFHWAIYNYFKNLQLQSNTESLGKSHATGIWKEFDENGKLLKEEDMDVMYDDRPDYIDKKNKLISIRTIGEKLSADYKKNMFSDNNFYDLKTLLDEKTSKWIYRIMFFDVEQGDTVEYFDYDAHNGNFLKKESILIPKKIDSR